jgi:signal transduction histidine kinase
MIMEELHSLYQKVKVLSRYFYYWGEEGKITFEIDSKIEDLIGDPTRLSQILINLLGKLPRKDMLS